MQEIWKDIEGYEGLYQVSNLGNIKSLKRKTWNGYIFVQKEDLILKPGLNAKKYLYVSLSKDNKTHTYRVHRLVAQTFIPNPENKPQVNHIDGNKSNNNVDNLEWCTNSENQIHAFKLGLKPSFIGSKNPNCKKINQYDLDGNFIKQWNSFYDIKRILNIDRSLIWRCCIGKFKQVHGYIWKYSDKNN